MFFRLTFFTVVLALSSVSCAQDAPSKSTNSDNPDQSAKPSKQQSENRSQERPVPPDRESREIFFRTLSETRSRGAQEFSYLLFQESIRKEIDLSDEGAKAAREVLAQTRTSAEKLYDQLKAKEINRDELKTKMLGIMSDCDRDIWKILVDSKANSDRLVGLFVQHRHCASVLNKIVAEKVGLEEPRRLEIIAKKEAIEREMFEDRSREAQNPGDRFRAWEKVQKKIDGVVSEMLTAEQREKLEGLKGKPFKFEEFAFPPGPPGRGRDGARERNRRDGDHDEKCRESEKLAGDR